MSERPDTFDFGRMAGSYDEWYKTRLGRTYDTLEKRAVARMLPDPINGNRLLDVGCGTGHWSAFFSKKGFVVTGVDVAPEMVGIAHEKGIASASFEVADAHSLPFEDGCFDVVAAMTTVEFVRDAETVVHEMVRCTRHPGGVILVGVLNAMARVNRLRKAAGKPPYDAARLFSPRGLRDMLASYGEAEVTSAAFVPSWPSFSSWATLADAMARLLHLPYGAFVVGRVRP